MPYLVKKGGTQPKNPPPLPKTINKAPTTPPFERSNKSDKEKGQN